jgi:hypothetical protein
VYTATQNAAPPGRFWTHKRREPWKKERNHEPHEPHEQKGGGAVVRVIGDKINGGRSLTSFRQGLYFRETGFSMHDIMIYEKKNIPFMRSNAYTNSHEFMFVLSKEKLKRFNPLKEKSSAMDMK